MYGKGPTRIRPFRINVSPEKLAKLRAKLDLVDFPEELKSDRDSPWTRGPPTADLRRLVNHWRKDFDWSTVEYGLNRTLPQFTVSIEVEGHGCYDVHFVHFRSTSQTAIPLIFFHGWPGSFVEVSKIGEPLAKGGSPGDPHFHVVAPSLLDHGFSSGTNNVSFHIDQHVEVYHKLMQALGYDQYVAQGGDTGYLMSRFLAQKYPDHCRAHHINMAVPRKPDPSRDRELFDRWQKSGAYSGLSAREQEQLQRARDFTAEGSGYFAIHTTRPMQLAYAVTDSPVGLLAWIYDKLVSWSDNYPWSMDEVITWVSIYYFSTAGPASSFNTYYTNQHRQPLTAFRQAAEYINTPLGISRFRKEIANMPKIWNESLGPICFFSEHDRGGHFAAYEVPELLIGDLRRMYSKESPAGSVFEKRVGNESSTHVHNDSLQRHKL